MVFKGAQLGAESNATDLQAQILSDRFRTSGLAGKGRRDQPYVLFHIDTSRMC